MAFDKSKFTEQFKAETREHLEAINLGLLKAEKNPQDTGLLKEIMRQAHSIKGSAMMMGYSRISEIAHGMESGLEKAMKGEVVLARRHFDILFKALDAIGPLLDDKMTWEEKGVERPFTEDLCKDIDGIFSGNISEVVPKPVKSPKPCLLYTSPSPRDRTRSRMPSSA